MLAHMQIPYQHTLAHSISCRGKGLHSGNDVVLTLKPAPEGSGIQFARTDIEGLDPIVPAIYTNVRDTRLCTALANDDGVRISTIEHLMAALWGCGIDNALIELNGEEVPIMDGSSEPFVFMVECAGIRKQSRPRRVFEVLKKVEVREDNKRMAIVPGDHFSVSLEINYDEGIVAEQSGTFRSSDVSFKTDLCRARSFCFEHEVEMMQSAGLAKGGSLDNAIVVGKDGILNQDGLRYNDEFVRHKMLDCIGDFFLMGGHVLGHFHGVRSGHAMNNKLLHAFFADRSAWREVQFAS